MNGKTLELNRLNINRFDSGYFDEQSSDIADMDGATTVVVGTQVDSLTDPNEALAFPFEVVSSVTPSVNKLVLFIGNGNFNKGLSGGYFRELKSYIQQAFPLVSVFRVSYLYHGIPMEGDTLCIVASYDAFKLDHKKNRELFAISYMPDLLYHSMSEPSGRIVPGGSVMSSSMLLSKLSPFSNPRFWGGKPPILEVRDGNSSIVRRMTTEEVYNLMKVSGCGVGDLFRVVPGQVVSSVLSGIKCT